MRAEGSESRRGRSPDKAGPRAPEKRSRPGIGGGRERPLDAPGRARVTGGSSRRAQRALQADRCRKAARGGGGRGGEREEGGVARQGEGKRWPQRLVT